MRPQVVVNGRFLTARPTGLHRVARSLLAAGRRAGLVAEVLAPSGCHDPLVQQRVPGPPGRLGGQVWEQLALPAAAGSRICLSLANTAPVLARHGVVFVHDLATVVGPQWFKPEMRVYGRLSLAAARRAEVVLTPTSQVAGELARAGVDAGRIRVVRNAVDDRFRPAPARACQSVRSRFGLEVPYMVMVGWADPRKDVGTVLAAHRRVSARRACELVLVGHPHRNFAAMAQPTGAGVKVIGYVDDELLPPLLSGACALLYPSRYEGFGLPPLEALACGTPALVSDIPAVAEAVGDAALRLPVGDVTAWSEAMLGVLDGGIRPGIPPVWSWDEAGRALLGALGEIGAA